ncbi:hypothetical protein GCM10010331_45140 [Streptomyces xanthochromogenes]|uniref:hypothetical protein n=1 Tax=Streptomyces xanthochromogenes TaxID=67384 RepID=UPI0016722A0B|nr:hypothetical protein [Streptomyces xanthochromogenes]GHB52493.1 hypothetical protein GCM10010331_45140 [Streptomyces xanthochromogenes]
MPIKTFAPHVSIVCPKVAAARQYVTRMDAHFAEGAHPVVELTVQFSAPRSESIQGWLLNSGRLLAEGTPIHLVYGSGPHQAVDFYGYVHAHRIESAETDAKFIMNAEVSVTYTLTGATSDMQSQQNRSWSSASPSFIARTICRGYRLAPLIQRSTISVRTERAQIAQSDFTFLRDLAAEYGLRLVVDNTSLYLTQPLVSLRRSREIPAFHLTKIPGIKDTVYTFDMVSGELEPAGGRRQRVEAYGYNRSTRVLSRTVARASAGARYTVYATDRPSASQAEASSNAAGASASGALWVQARARVRGDARVKVGHEIWLQGVGMGPSAIGTWMVREASHHMEIHPTDSRLSTYRCDVMVGRNRSDGLDAIHNTDLGPASSTTALSNGRWHAQYIGAR